MNHRGSLIAALSLFCLPPVGCAVSKIVESGGRSFNTSYSANQVYLTKKGLFLFRFVNGSRSKARLEAPGNNQKGPDSLEEFERGNRTKWPTLLGIVQPKTRIRISRTELVEKANFGNILFVYGEIIDGPFAGQEVDLTFISRQHVEGEPSVLVPTIDPAHLELSQG